MESPAHAAVANAVGAALTLPTAALEIYADTGSGLLRAPALDLEERIGKGYTLSAAERRAQELLAARLASGGVSDAAVEITEAEMFATLDDGGYGSKDIRVGCQVVPALPEESEGAAAPAGNPHTNVCAACAQRPCAARIFNPPRAVGPKQSVT